MLEAAAFWAAAMVCVAAAAACLAAICSEDTNGENVSKSAAWLRGMFTFALRSIMLSCSVLQQSSNQTKRGHNQKVLEEEGNGWNYAARS